MAAMAAQWPQGPRNGRNGSAMAARAAQWPQGLLSACTSAQGFRKVRKYTRQHTNNYKTIATNGNKHKHNTSKLICNNMHMKRRKHTNNHNTTTTHENKYTHKTQVQLNTTHTTTTQHTITQTT
jgi:hypothetical protein